MKTIRIKPTYSVIVHSADHVEIRQGVWNNISHMIHDDSNEGVLAKIILGLKDQLAPNDIASKTNISRSKVESVLDYLQQLGVLQAKSESFIDFYVENLIPTFRRPGQYKYQINMPIVFLGDKLINEKIATQLNELTEIVTHSYEDLWQKLITSSDEWLYDALQQERFIEQFACWKGKCLIYSSRHINPIIATRINRITHLLNIAWLHFAVDGPFILIGPTFNNQNACYDCFETRVSMNLREADNYQQYKNAIAQNQVYTQNDDPLLQLTANLLASHASIEILNFLTTNCSFTTNKLLTIFLPTMEFVYHDLLKLPTCRTCGSVSFRDNAQLYFDFQQLVGDAL